MKKSIVCDSSSNIPRHTLAKKVHKFLTGYSRPEVDRGEIADYALGFSKDFPEKFISAFLERFCSALSHEERFRSALSRMKKAALEEANPALALAVKKARELILAAKIMSCMLNKKAYITVNTYEGFRLVCFFREPAVVAPVP